MNTTNRHPGGRTALFAAGVVAAVLLTGCGGDEDGSTPKPDSAASAAPTTEPTEPAAPKIPAKPVDGRFIRGLNPADTPDERAAAEVWFAYREEVSRMIRDVDVNRPLLEKLARGEGITAPVAYVDQMRAAGTHNVGGTIASIKSVAIRDGEIAVYGCLRSTMIEVDADGRPVEPLENFVGVLDTLVRQGSTWVVERRHNTSIGERCRYR